MSIFMLDAMLRFVESMGDRRGRGSLGEPLPVAGFAGGAKVISLLTQIRLSQNKNNHGHGPGIMGGLIQPRPIDPPDRRLAVWRDGVRQHAAISSPRRR
jgi:hypothetical protein